MAASKHWSAARSRRSKRCCCGRTAGRRWARVDSVVCSDGNAAEIGGTEGLRADCHPLSPRDEQAHDLAATTQGTSAPPSGASLPTGTAAAMNTPQAGILLPLPPRARYLSFVPDAGGRRCRLPAGARQGRRWRADGRRPWPLAAVGAGGRHRRPAAFPQPGRELESNCRRRRRPSGSGCVVRTAANSCSVRVASNGSWHRRSVSRRRSMPSCTTVAAT
jgi:hypothetical protein